MKSLSLPGVFVSLFLFIAPCWSQPAFNSPQATFDAYLQACQNGDYGKAEFCYTESSRKMVAEMGDGKAKRDPELLKSTFQKLQAVSFKTEQVNPSRAILWASDKSIPPFLLRIQDPKEGWRIDYHFMTNYIKVSDGGWSWRNPRILKIWKSRN